MNSCVLMAKVVTSPELRYTPDQLAVTNMFVEFEGLGPNDPPQTLKAVSFGNLATDINQTYKQGDQVVLEGRLSMNTIERQEGFKEKRAEFIIARIYAIGTVTHSFSNSPNTATPTPSPSNVVPFQNNPTSAPTTLPSISKEEPPEEDLDEIPF